MGFIDSHVHFHFPDFDKDRGDALTRARDSGIDQFINVGTDLPTSKASKKLAEENPDFWATAGIHPHDASQADDDNIRALETLLKHPRVIAIGEVGLDFFRNLSPQQVQIEALKKFLVLQDRVKKPLILHCRDAYEEMISLFLETRQPPYDGIMHCFSSNKPMMKRLVDLGFYISFAGPLTYKKNDELREACGACPLDRLILETDAPFLPPQSKRGKRNESSYMLETAQVAANLHGIPMEKLAEITSANTRKVLRL